MRKINLRWIFSLLIGTALAGCGNNSSDGNASSDVANTDSVAPAPNTAEVALPQMSPQQVIDTFIAEMKVVDRMIFNENINGAKARFDGACSKALMYIDRMSDEERSEAYEYWAQITNSPQIRNLDSFNFDTPTGMEFAKRIEEMRIKHDENSMSLIGTLLEFTDKAGTRFILHINKSENEPGSPQNEGICLLYPVDRDEEYSGTWKFQSKDLGMSSLRIIIKDIKGFDEDWNTVDRGVDFGGAHDYHNSHYEFFPSSSSNQFYIVKGKIWPYFIETDGFNEYEQFALSYTAHTKEPSGE